MSREFDLHGKGRRQLAIKHAKRRYDWARSVSGARLRTSYAYNNAGDLFTIDYADATPDVTNTYDRLGRLKTTTDAAGSLTRSYQNGRPDDETYAAGSAHLSGFSVTRTQGTYNRPATLGATSFTSLTYGYDTAGRLSTLTQGPADRVRSSIVAESAA